MRVPPSLPHIAQATLALIALSFLLVVFTASEFGTYGRHLGVDLSDQLTRTTDSTGSLAASRPLVSGETLASTASALIITAINLCLRTLILSLNGYQGRDTLEAEQISLYTKLAFAYVANNVVVAAAHAALIAYQTCDAGLALLSVSNCSLVQQSWYERGGVVDSVATLIVTTGLADAISIAFPIDVFFQRCAHTMACAV